MTERYVKYEASAKEDMEYVDEIPKLRSGKFCMTVCKIPDKMQ